MDSVPHKMQETMGRRAIRLSLLFILHVNNNHSPSPRSKSRRMSTFLWMWVLIGEFCCLSISTVKHLWAYYEWVLFVLCRWAMLLLATYVCVWMWYVIVWDSQFIWTWNSNFSFVRSIVLLRSFSGLYKLFVIVTNYFSIRKINILIGLAPFLFRFIFQCFTRSR